ncbi:hypothetical protein F183_A55350 (plasmid) [Bryobacterales bacterium F-183]|nr:hypothetical protein F183_A55350 [Bryobacterales bacterium F-183]
MSDLVFIKSRFADYPFGNMHYILSNSKGQDVSSIRDNLQLRAIQITSLPDHQFDTVEEAFAFYHVHCDPETGQLKPQQFLM